MAEKTLNGRLILDRRTHQEWIAANPIAKYGELMIVEVPFDSSTVEQEPCFLLKIGDGVHSYNQLNWFSGLAADVYDWAKESNKPSYSIDEITGLANTLGSLNAALSQKQPIGNYLTQETADGRYLQFTDTVASANQLATSHNFSIMGGATASAVAFNGTQDVTLNITSLDATKLSGIIPAANLPSYVDDVLEYDNLAAFPSIGETGKIYIAKDTNLTYRWSGSQYVQISPSLALGDYVVETGEDLGWAYRKWLSGFVEIWKRVTFEGDINIPIGNMYYGTVPSEPYPFSIMYPKIQATYASTYGYIAWFGGPHTNSSIPSDTETGSMSLIRPTIRNNELGFYICT